MEVYDLDNAAPSKLANVATRAFVSTGGDIVIGGFILGKGTRNDTIVVRGIGPSLAASGLFPVLADPTLELFNSNGVLIDANDNCEWFGQVRISLKPQHGPIPILSGTRCCSVDNGSSLRLYG